QEPHRRHEPDAALAGALGARPGAHLLQAWKLVHGGLFRLQHDRVREIGIVEMRDRTRRLVRNRKQPRGEGLAKLGGEGRHIGEPGRARRAISRTSRSSGPSRDSSNSVRCCLASPRVLASARPADKSGGDSRPMAMASEPLWYATGKNGVPAGTLAAAANRKFPM